MAIWIRNDEGDFVTAHTVTHEGHTFILTEKEYDALGDFGAEARSEVVKRHFLQSIGALDGKTPHGTLRFEGAQPN